MYKKIIMFYLMLAVIIITLLLSKYHPVKSILIFFQVATKTLPFYKDYFSVPYPLPKIDLIAIADFAAGLYHFY